MRHGPGLTVDIVISLEYCFDAENLDTLFDRLPELNEYTKVASPGILKRVSANGHSFVVKSALAEDIAAQRNELKSGLAILDAVKKFAPSPIARFGFDLTITVPEAVLCTTAGRIMSVMLLHPFPTLDEILVRSEGRTGTMMGHLENVRSLYDFFSQHGIFWRDMAPRNILVDERHLSPRYVILDFEKTLMDVDDLDVAEKQFWRGAVISEEFLSVCPMEAVAQVFGDKYDPPSWDTEATGNMPRADMRREIESIAYLDEGRNLTVGEYNCLDRLLVATRSPIDDGGDGSYFPGKMCFFVDHILGPAHDRKLNEVFLVTRACGQMAETCRIIHNTMVSAGADVKDMICASKDDNVFFDGDMLKDCIDDLYVRNVGEARSIDLFLGHAGISRQAFEKEGA